MDKDEKWSFYKAENFEKPSQYELQYVKAIFIPGSHYRIKNKIPKDESIIKKYIKKGNNSSVEVIESSRGSAD